MLLLSLAFKYSVDMKKIVLFLVVVAGMCSAAFAQKKDSLDSKMEWFGDAKLGIFIHWGIYSVNGIGESWSFHNRELPWEDYMQQLDGFTAKNYNPKEWASLIKESGAQYAVMTTMHHDGVCLWNSKFSKSNTVKKTPAKQDVLTPFYAALRAEGLKCGAYYSLINWSHADYPGFLKDSTRYKIEDDPKKWNKFLKVCHGQIDEVMVNFNPDLVWFDGDWEHSAEEWKAKEIRENILSHNPNTIINGRLQGYGDYDTPEQNFPVVRPNLDYWELCMTTNSSWGWQPKDTEWKTPYEIITIFADAISNGGNLLLDIGPKEDGTIPQEQVHILKELGKWTSKHQAAIYSTIAGLPQGHFYGASTYSKDSTKVYLFVPGKTQGPVFIKGLDTKIKNIKVVGTDTKLEHKIVGKISWSPIPGLVFIHIPEEVQDTYMTVLEVELEEAVKLYRGKGGLF